MSQIFGLTNNSRFLNVYFFASLIFAPWLTNIFELTLITYCFGIIIYHSYRRGKIIYYYLQLIQGFFEILLEPIIWCLYLIQTSLIPDYIITNWWKERWNIDLSKLLIFVTVINHGHTTMSRSFSRWRLLVGLNSFPFPATPTLLFCPTTLHSP